MDLDPDISILYSAPKSLIPEKSVRIRSSKNYNRKSLPDNIESELDETWDSRLNENPQIFNGTKFRVHNVHGDSDSLTLHLGITCYKDFLTTNWPPHVHKLKRLGSVEMDNDRAYLSDAMGVGALVLSRDQKVILLRRSSLVAEAAGQLDVPGGHSEPENLVGNKSVDDIRPDDLGEAEIVHEIFDSIIREITDEVNIPAHSLDAPLIMGVAGNNHSAGRPSLEFLVRCSLTSEEIVRRYHLGNQAEAEESTSILMVEENEVLKLRNSSMWSQLAPSAKGCFSLYHMTR